MASPFILSFSPFPTFRHPTISSKTGLDGRVTWRSGKCHSRTPSSWHMQKASKICHKLYKPSLRFPNSPHAAAKTIVKSCLNSFQQLKSRCRFLFSSLLPGFSYFETSALTADALADAVTFAVLDSLERPRRERNDRAPKAGAPDGRCSVQ